MNQNRAGQGQHMGPRRGPMGNFGMPMGMPGQKAKDAKRTFRRLISYLKPFRLKLLAVIVMAVCGTIFSIVSPKILGKATTKLFEGLIAKMHGVPGAGIDFGYISHIIVVLIGLYAFSSLFSYIQQYLMSGIAQKTVYGLRKDVNEKLSRLPLKYFDSQTHGEILSRAVNDMDNISGTLQQSLTQVMTSVVTLIGIIVMMLTISPLMTCILLLTLPLSFISIKTIASRSKKHFIAQQKALGELNGHVEEMYTGHKIIKAFGYEEKSVLKFDAINDEYYESGWRAQFISGIMMPIMTIINNIGYVLICVVGGVLATKKAIEIGDIQAFIQYARQFSMPIVQTANIANIIQSTLASAERVFEILDEQEEVPDEENAEIITEPMGIVRFENVSFGYKEDAYLIDDMNIHVKQGETVAIVGPTGAGKTTLVNLMMRFYEINEGVITVDGTNIMSIGRDPLRKMFGMVLQDTWLFNGTIRDNIGYGKIGATEEEIVAAAKAAHADHFIRTLPDGYDTILNEEASNISQGQKQLLTIARALLANPSILILDEATSSVDTRTEIHIQHAMKELMKGRTNFVIAHRLSTVRDADLILVMNHGRVMEQGKHEELLENGGLYAELYYSQFSKGTVA